jgi:hypothetical protein
VYSRATDPIIDIRPTQPNPQTLARYIIIPGHASCHQVSFTLPRKFSISKLHLNCCHCLAGLSFTMSLLLSLPLPIRKRIWETVLLCKAHNSRLLMTCRQINAEADGLIYRRSQTFQSQEELSSWLERIDSRYFDRVENVTLHLQDLGVLPLAEEQFWPTVSLFDLYRVEAERLLADFARLPNIRHLAIYKSDSVRSYLYNEFYGSSVIKISRELQLRTLAFHSDEISLDFLKALPNLRGLSFTGYSKSTPMETLNILSHLRHLTSIKLVQLVTPTVVDNLNLDLSLSNFQSLTRDVIKGLRGLKSFTITESGDQIAHTWTPFTQGFIQALDSGHRTSLQDIRIALEHTPDSECQRSFSTLLTASSLKHIEVSWPALDASLVQSLPRTVETLSVPPSTSRPPYWILNAIQWRKRELPLLREVRLINRSEAQVLSPQVSIITLLDSATACLMAFLPNPPSFNISFHFGM